MGFISGSASFTRFRVKGKVTGDYRERYAQEIRRFAFREIEETCQDERSLGWVNIMNILDSEFLGEEFFKGEYLALSMRIDTRRVPSHVVKQHCQKFEQEKKTAQARDFLSKAERQEIREAVQMQLLKRAIPNSRTFDCIWDIQKGQVLFSSTSEGICTDFQELFKNTFDLILEQIFPYTLAQSLLTDEQKVLLERISTASFI